MIAQFKKDSYRWSPLAMVFIIVLACVALPDAIQEKTFAKPGRHITLRQVWSGPGVDTCGAPSPDGRYLSYTDWETGDLATRELTTGKTRHLTKKATWKDPKAFALNSIISPDGKIVAYSWFNQYGTYDLCLIGMDGSGDRTLCSNKDYEVYPVSWSSDGKRIAARKYGGESNFEIILVSVEDGYIQVLKSFEGPPFWGRFCYSPDDRFIVYDFPVADNSGNYDISLLNTDGNGEIPLIKHPANDRLLGWVPGRNEILFLSDRSGTQDLWMIQATNGRPQGSPKRIKSDIGQISPMGLTQDGSFYFDISSRLFNTYIATLDLETGKVLAPLNQPFIGSNFFPEWSPDGEYIAYVSEEIRPGGPGFFDDILHVRSLKTGQEREVSCELKRLRNPRWSPDGRSILVSGYDKNNRQEEYNGGLYKIDVKDGNVTALVQYAAGTLGIGEWGRIAGEWSPDGEAIFYINRGSILMRQLESGREKKLYSDPNLITQRKFRLLAFSPDGQKIVFGLDDPEKGSKRLMIMPASGGKPHELLKLQDSGRIKAIAWTSDGEYILFTKEEKKGTSLWQIAPEGGESQRLWESEKDLRGLRIHPDRQQIAFYNIKRNSEVWVMENFLPGALVAKPARQPNFRKIRIPTKIFWDAQLSPDGQKVALAYDGKLWIMPLSGKLGPEFPGAPVKLNTGDVKVSRFGFAWSADGKWIAFNENSETPEKLKDMDITAGIYVVPAKGGKPKKVYENDRGGLFLNYGISLSPHGKTLAFSSVDGNEVHICAISVDGGLPKQLVDASAREPAFSPDGKMIAYVEGHFPNNFGKLGRDLWVMPAHGGTPKLVANAGSAKSPIWSPDSNMIAFIDGNQTCIVPVGEDGEAAGQVMTIDQPETINFRRLVGWTLDNKIGAVFGSPVERALYTLPVKGGMAALVAHGGFPAYPRWSPDGKRIFHTNVADEGSGAWQSSAIAFVPAEGGKVTTVPIQSDAKIRLGGGNISPDGTMIVFSGMTQESSSMHIWTLPVEGGKPKQLTKPSEESMTEEFPCWSPDGKAIAFVRARRSEKYYRYTGEMNIYIVQLNGGEPKPLKSESDHVAFGPIAWSPDGRLLAYFSRYEASSPDGTLKVIPVDGGESRVVGKVQNIHLHKELAWSPDSKRIAFNGPKYEDKVIKVISLNDGSIVDIETNLVDTTRIYHLDWSPDGESLVFAGYTGGGPEFWVMENFLPTGVSQAK